MLLRFQVANHRSIHTPVELSLVALDRERESARHVDAIGEGVLAVAGIYGPNASGKSNVLDAIDWLAAAVGGSLKDWTNGVPSEPFRFATGPGDPSRYEIDLLVEGVRFTYRLETAGGDVRSESLEHYPHRRRNMLFERDENKVTLGRALRSAGGIRELTAPSTLAISAALRLDHEPVARCARTIASMTGRHSTRRGRQFEESTQWWMSSRQLTLFETDSTSTGDERTAALRLLQAADLGITDVDFVASGERWMRPLFTHLASSQLETFDPTEESLGTMVWFELIGPLLTALRHGRVLLIDELDASLHPALSARVVQMFQDPLTNPHGGQLIFTTHDTTLLNVLNRDEVWLTEKGPDGATVLTALAEFKVRKDLNIERSYVHGRFGAIPDVKDHLVLEALVHEV